MVMRFIWTTKIMESNTQLGYLAANWRRLQHRKLKAGGRGKYPGGCFQGSFWPEQLGIMPCNNPAHSLEMMLMLLNLMTIVHDYETQNVRVHELGPLLQSKLWYNTYPLDPTFSRIYASTSDQSCSLIELTSDAFATASSCSMTIESWRSGSSALSAPLRFGGKEN